MRVEEYSYYVNKLRLKTWIWRQIMMSQPAHTKYKLHHMPMVNGQWFIVSYDSANKQKHHKSHRMQ